jgi:SAM-dependent methyltransferase
MYESIKGIIKSIIPQKFLIANEGWIRYINYKLLYQGHQFKCPVCNSGLKNFILLTNGETLCPKCGSLARNRRLWSILEQAFLKGGNKILDFSPSRSLYRKLKSISSINYTSTDFAGEFIADLRFDITQIDSPDNSFDVIICYHILEHIPNDKKAMKELWRVLKKGGTCLIQTPLKEGKIYEDWSITSEKERKIHFGQEDHVRVYSINGLMERLSDAGFQVDLKKFVEASDNYFGFKEEEYVYFATKPF